MAESHWHAMASVRLDEIIAHGDENGDIANATGDDLRDVVRVAVERLDMHAARHLDVLTHFVKTDPDLVRKLLAGVEDIDMRPQVSIARELLREARAHLGAIAGAAGLAASGVIVAIDRELAD